MTRFRLPLVGALLASALVFAAPAHAQKVRIGYWSSGVSLGFGALLETGKFMEQQGLEVEYVKFPDVNAPTKAMAANSIDFAIGASAGSALSVTADGLPMSIILATQVAELKFVVPMDSPIKTLADLKGKKIGMSPPGSATAAITSAILESSVGLKTGEFQVVPGNDPRLAQFLVQKDIDAAALRTVTLATIGDVKFREIGDFRVEWKKMTRQEAPPVLGVGLARNDWLKQQPQAAAKVVAAMRKAFEYGKANKGAIVKALVVSANMKSDDAQAYAALWDGIYTVAMEPGDVASLRRQFDIFKAVGAVKGTLPDAAFNTAPYQQSKAIK